jgi:hypothetical protein
MGNCKKNRQQEAEVKTYLFWGKIAKEATRHGLFFAVRA